jgi:LmbE family N-acetylglucosaminyl deacetylase
MPTATGRYVILCVGPHPDDVEGGMAGSILTFVAQGHEVHVCDLTDGEPFCSREPIGLKGLDDLVVRG